MAEFIEVRTTIEGHEKAAAFAHGILIAGLATSIDIAQVPAKGSEIAWELTLVTPQQQAAALEEHIRADDDAGPAVSQPVLNDIDACPDWLSNRSDPS
jgi:hypothetical protein